MRALLCQKTCSALLLSLLLWTGFTSGATAQEDTFYRDPARPQRGYWKLFTHAASASTTIRFFDGDGRLLYEEVFTRQYVKLTGRNIAAINEAFDQITSQSLLRSRVTATDLPADPRERLPAPVGHQTGSGTETAGEKPDAGIGVSLFAVGSTGKLKLLIENPRCRKLYLCLKADNGRIIYSETTRRPGYMRTFDLTGIPSGKHTFLIHSEDDTFYHSSAILVSPLARSVQIRSEKSGSDHQPVADHQPALAGEKNFR